MTGGYGVNITMTKIGVASVYNKRDKTMMRRGVMMSRVSWQILTTMAVFVMAVILICNSILHRDSALSAAHLHADKIHKNDHLL